MTPPDPNNERREYDASYTLDREIAEARRRMGERKWDELQREWK